jgi:hypothetical protein
MMEKGKMGLWNDGRKVQHKQRVSETKGLE